MIFWREKRARSASFALPVASQMVPALFRRFSSRFDVVTSCWKAHCWCVKPFIKMIVYFQWYAGTHIVTGDGKPPRFRLKCRCRAFANLPAVLLAAVSRLLSRCYLCSFRPPLLHSYCTDGPASHEETSLSCPSTGRYCRRNMQGKCARGKHETY